MTCTIDLLPFNRGKLFALLTCSSYKAKIFYKQENTVSVYNRQYNAMVYYKKKQQQARFLYLSQANGLLSSAKCRKKTTPFPLILDYSNLGGCSFPRCIVSYACAPTHWNSETKYSSLNRGKSKCKSMNNSYSSPPSSEGCSHQQKLQHL